MSVAKVIPVTDRAGFIGSSVVRRLIARGETVVNVDRLTYAGNLDSLAEARDSDRHRLERGVPGGMYVGVNR
ncbi:hypothetical protein BH23GEM9_BH23GEM9_23520 [soil metagenome]